ncbi:MAG: J domain-containing protein [Planctomycetota bacterium]
MDLIMLGCWSCDALISQASLEYDAVLVPRSASRGGPVLVIRCSECGLDNVAERNRAGEFLLIPPSLANLAQSNVRGSDVARARKWGRDHAIERAEFLARERPAMSSPAAEAGEVADDSGDEPKTESPPRRAPVTDIDSIFAAYEVMGLEVTATPDEIRKRYRELSKKCHPDRVADLDEEIRRAAERRFGEVRKAYDLLIGD